MPGLDEINKLKKDFLIIALEQLKSVNDYNPSSEILEPLIQYSSRLYSEFWNNKYDLNQNKDKHGIMAKNIVVWVFKMSSERSQFLPIGESLKPELKDCVFGYCLDIIQQTDASVIFKAEKSLDNSALLLINEYLDKLIAKDFTSVSPFDKLRQNLVVNMASYYKNFASENYEGDKIVLTIVNHIMDNMKASKSNVVLGDTAVDSIVLSVLAQNYKDVINVK